MRARVALADATVLPRVFARVLATVFATVFVAVVVFVLAAVAGFAGAGFVAGPAVRDHRDARAFAQAFAVDQLLVEGTGSRLRLASAVDLATRCVRLDTAVADLVATRQERLDQRRLLEFLDLSRLERAPAGPLRAALRVALLRSADTDAALLGWARARQANGCAVNGVVGVSDEAFARARRVESAYRVAMRASDTSTAAKRTFLDRWNPVASRFGLPARTEHSI